MGKRLTEEGKKFIRTICSGDSNDKISGKNRYNLPFSTIEDTVTVFTSQAIDHLGKPITSNKQLAEALIYWFDKYAAEYDLDANIIAAQAYQESGYKIWNYAPRPSTASGISQFVGLTFYEVIIRNMGPAPHLSESEKAKLTANLTNPTLQTSYSNYVIGSDSRNNRVKLFQNIIDNPDLMIKAQCKLMKFISDRNNGLASSALFAYNRGSGYKSQDYLSLVKHVANDKGTAYIQEGVNYVEKIFGYLGDKENTKISTLGKPKGIWFGYKLDFEFESFNANLG